jgi:hypothetical protein
MGTCGSKAAPVTSGRSSTVDHSLGAYPTTPRASTSSTGNEIWRNASDLRTPPKDPNNPPSLDEVDKLVRGDGDQIALFVRTKSDDMLDGRFKEEQTIVYYLYGRRFGEESSRKERVGRILEFLKDTKTKQRMLNIVTLSNDKAKAMLEPVWSRCQMAVILFGNRPGAKTIFQDNKIPFVWRHQQSKNCFLQAVSSLLGYKVAQGNSEFCGTSGDVDQYVRDYYSNEDLYNRVVLNKGRSSTQVIEALVGWQSIASHNMRLSDRSNADFLVKEIDNLGPCTVCRFLTDSTFRAADDEGSCIDDWSYTTDDYHAKFRNSM